jgi:hypothetical protein
MRQQNETELFSENVSHLFTITMLFFLSMDIQLRLRASGCLHEVMTTETSDPCFSNRAET